MSEPFSVRIAVRGYELDPLGHVNQAVYHQYAEHARLQLFRQAGLSFDELVRSGSAPVMLSSTIVYRRELRGTDEVDVTATVKFGQGKTFQMGSVITKIDGTVSAEIECTLGLMDLAVRKLLDDPRGRMRALSTDPGLFDRVAES